MANPYHDELGRYCSSDEMGAAVDRLAAAGNFEAAYELAKEHTAASKLEMETTLSEMKAFGVPEPVAVAVGATKRQATTATKRTPKVINSLAVPSSHTYKPAGIEVNEDRSMYSRHFTGNKYADSYRPIAGIAKDVRSDFAEAQEKGYLPKNLKFSVRSESYSGGSSMHVTIQGAKDKDLYTTGDEETRPEWGEQIYTENAREILSRAKGIVDAYRVDSSDPQIDYFSTNFYGFVDIESERSAKWREKEAAKDKIKREGYKQRKDILAKVAADKDKVFAASNTPKSTADGKGSFGFVPGTQMLVVQGTYSRPFSGGPDVSVQEVYDLTGFTAKEGGKLEDAVGAMNLYDLRINFGKNKFYPVKAKRTRRY